MIKNVLTKNKLMGNVIFLILALAANYIGITITKLLIGGGF